MPAGIEFRLAHAKQLRAIAQNAQKNDAVDARLLARMLHAGLIPEAYPRSPRQREMLRLVRHRCTLVRQRTQLAQRIHSQLQQNHLQLPREQLLRRAGWAWLQTVAWPALTPEQRALVHSHGQLIRTLAPMIRQLDRRIRAEAAQWPLVTLLQSVPGIGPYWGLLLAAELAPVSRFRTAVQLVSYSGLAPVTRSSGGHTRYGSLPRDANRWVRWALVSATATHVQRAPASRLSQAYQRLKGRIGWRKARIAAARKLALTLYGMLQHQTVWQP
jgi:transposase